MHETLAASNNSRIKDADYAKETTQMIKQQILQQSEYLDFGSS